ncbi:MAG: tetratricopeptide repeat protein [Desulfovibrionales bacterium]|nr:MAG: tetratricopeptide repeat protein [Desulfovibrionales bacterium]
MQHHQNPSTASLSQDIRIKGVFSTTAQQSVGFGHTKRKVIQNVLVYAVEEEDGKISIQSLNAHFMPTGTVKMISRNNLLKNYLPEPDVYISKVYPAIRKVAKAVARGERHLRNNETFSAETEFKTALRIDEENIRATFGLGLSYLARGDIQRGDIVFRRLVRLRAAFEPEHKHMFNEFGISLRKSKMYPQALKYYARAQSISGDDENLFFNMARTFQEKGRETLALKFVSKALAINPNLIEAQKFRIFLENRLAQKNGVIPWKP